MSTASASMQVRRRRLFSCTSPRDFSFQASRRGAPPVRKVHCALPRAALLLPRCHAVRDVLLVVAIGGGTSVTTEPCSPRFFLVLLGAALLPPALLVVSLL